MFWLDGDSLLRTALVPAKRKTTASPRKNLFSKIRALKLKKRASDKRPIPSPPAAASFVAFTGSVTVSVTKKTVTNGAPIRIKSDAVFSAALLNMG
jgi:hypothetical protein